jgi:hypothetical protein
MSRREAAEATLDGQVNDWVAVAVACARDVIELCDEADVMAESHRREMEAARLNFAALEVRAADAVAAAERARAVADESAVEVGRLRVLVEAWRTTAVNLNGRIVEQADNGFTFAYGSRGVIEAFRKLIGV